MKIRKLLAAYKIKLFGKRTRWESVGLCGTTLTIAAGTKNKKTDKDDAWWHALAQTYSVIFDIGANVGYSSILATIMQKDKQIVLADPNPKALDVARCNLERNGMGSNKYYINAFVGENNGDCVKFYTVGTGASASMYGSHAHSAKVVNAYCMVATTTVDDIVTETGITPSLVKIDVEAAESYTLNGAKQLAARHGTIFMVEMHGPEEMPMEKNAGLVLDWCKECNYNAYYMKEHSLLQSTQQIAHRGRCHLLLLPKGMPYPECVSGINEGGELR